MTYSYSAPLTYGQPQALTYDGMTENKPSSPSSIPYAAGGLVVGAAAGGYVGNKINPFVSKKGEATDTFAHSVLTKHMASSAPEAERKVYYQTQEVLKQIDGVSSPDELKTLLGNNKDAANKIMGNSNDFLQNVTEENLVANKKTIKEKFVAENKTFLQDIKNQIQASWDKEGKKFVKPDSVKQDVFDTITKATNGVKGKIIAKYAVISGLAAGAVAYIAHKISNKNNIQP